MKKYSIRNLGALVALVVLPLAIIGCGGGGGGGGGGTPRPTPTLAPGNRTLIVQLRDSSNLPVDGIVIVGDVVRATNEGQATIQPVAAGTVRVTVEVNGVEINRNATVASTGSTTFVFVVPTGITATPGPTSTAPPPPF